MHAAGREERVLERAEAEDADARLAVGDAGLPEGVEVDCEPAARDERPEACGDGRSGRAAAHLRPFLDAGDLAVAERVPDVREDLGREGDDEPDRGTPCRRSATAPKPATQAEGEDAWPARFRCSRRRRRVSRRVFAPYATCV